MKLVPRSLAMRVIGFSSIWAILALLLIATVISTIYRQASERNFENLLSAQLFNLIASVGLDDQRRLTGAPQFGDIRYSQPRSGWYWAVEPIEGIKVRPLRSQSMVDEISGPPAKAVPFDAEFQRSYVTTGLGAERVRAAESEFILGDNNEAFRFRVMGNETEFREDLSAFNRVLATYLSIFGIGMVAINAGAILLGFRPLDRVRQALEGIRQGKAKGLDGSFPKEIEPLAREMNALIDNNRRIVERSRTQVGNLAHSLKTPLSVLYNEADAIGGAKGKLVREQAEAMRSQVDHYLHKARIAAQSGSVVFRADASEAITRMVRVMAKIADGKQVRLNEVSAKLMFAGEKQDFEEIAGNLLENAVKWANSEVLVTLEPIGGNRLRLAIEDDGPGIADSDQRDALKRGGRLDETKPGTGLGLAIVAELCGEYGGVIDLGRSRLGGLRAEVLLPAVAKDNT